MSEEVESSVPLSSEEVERPPYTDKYNLDEDLDDPVDKPAPSLSEKAVDWTFLKSTRFWSMVIGAFAVYLKMRGLIGDAEMQLIATIAAGFVVVKTVDKFK